MSFDCCDDGCWLSLVDASSVDLFDSSVSWAPPVYWMIPSELMLSSGEVRWYTVGFSGLELNGWWYDGWWSDDGELWPSDANGHSIGGGRLDLCDIFFYLIRLVFFLYIFRFVLVSLFVFADWSSLFSVSAPNVATYRWKLLMGGKRRREKEKRTEMKSKHKINKSFTQSVIRLVLIKPLHTSFSFHTHRTEF